MDHNQLLLQAPVSGQGKRGKTQKLGVARNLRVPKEGVRACHSPGLRSCEVWAPTLLVACSVVTDGGGRGGYFCLFMLQLFQSHHPTPADGSSVGLALLLPPVMWGSCLVPVKGRKAIML